MDSWQKEDWGENTGVTKQEGGEGERESSASEGELTEWRNQFFLAKRVIL